MTKDVFSSSFLLLLRCNIHASQCSRSLAAACDPFCFRMTPLEGVNAGNLITKMPQKSCVAICSMQAKRNKILRHVFVMQFKTSSGIWCIRFSRGLSLGASEANAARTVLRTMWSKLSTERSWHRHFGKDAGIVDEHVELAEPGDAFGDAGLGLRPATPAFAPPGANLCATATFLNHGRRTAVDRQGHRSPSCSRTS